MPRFIIDIPDEDWKMICDAVKSHIYTNEPGEIYPTDPDVLDDFLTNQNVLPRYLKYHNYRGITITNEET